MKKNLILLFVLFFANSVCAQHYWQQAVDYKMEVTMDVDDYTYEGTQQLKYTNNAPDTLNKVFFHLFYNAFQPGSEMAVRVKTGADKNGRFKVDIDSLQPADQGRLQVFDLKQNGVALETQLSGTILEVTLAEPLTPGSSTQFDLRFEGQVPAVVRRAGKNSSEGVALTMTQWFPKIAEYDYDGWNAEPYLGREYHGVWGDYEVKITIDKDYTVAASGYLQNAEDIGKGYSETKKSKAKKGMLTWHFRAPKVHDFSWGADPDYIHDTYSGPEGVTLHFFYKNKPEIIENWKKLQPLTAALMDFYNTHIGPYPYQQYSVVQGGDGGMEYAMMTFVTGERKFGSLVGVTAHELAHSWFQHILATNEMKHEWMDEGFTSYISAFAQDLVLEENKTNPVQRSYMGYYNLATSGVEEPQATNANRYNYNYAYESTAYNKGAVFLAQLGYIIGQEKLAETIKAYYDEFKFKHPTPNDFRRVAERVSGIQLKWYLTDWTQTTKTIDYEVAALEDQNNSTRVTLNRIGELPMPLDVLVNYKDGSQAFFYIPLPLMRGEKENPYQLPWTVLKDWAWAYPEYQFDIPQPKSNISSIVIDPSQLMADIIPENNYILLEQADDK